MSDRPLAGDSFPGVHNENNPINMEEPTIIEGEFEEITPATEQVETTTQEDTPVVNEEPIEQPEVSEDAEANTIASEAEIIK